MTTCPPPVYWPTVAGWLRLTEPQAGKLWRLIAASHDPRVRAWRLTLGYFHCAPVDRASCQALLAGPLAPRRIIDALEVLVQDGRPSRVLYTQTYTPGTVSLERDNRYAVIFEKEGYGREEVALDPVVNGWVFGNIFFGGLIGLTIDFINGAAYHLSPTPIAVALAPATPAETPEGPSAQIIPQPRAPDNVPAVDTQPLIPALPAPPVERPLVAITPSPAPAVALPTVQVPPPAPAVALPTVQVQLLYYVVPLFSAPDAYAERLGRVHHSVALTLLETCGKWLYIQAPSGQRGWILQEWIQQ